MAYQKIVVLVSAQVAVLAVLLANAYDVARYFGGVAGTLEARYDILLGTYEYRRCDPLDCSVRNESDKPVEVEYRAILKSRYGISSRLFCRNYQGLGETLPLAYLGSYAWAYTEAMSVALDRKYGKAFFIRVHKEAIEKLMASQETSEYSRVGLRQDLEADIEKLKEIEKREDRN